MAGPATTTGKVKNEAAQAANAAQQAVDNPWAERFIRLGYMVRGLLYVVVGVLALQVAAGAGGKTTTKSGAIGTLAGEPFGKFLLIVIAVGLAGYALWGFIRALFDPLHRGTDAKGIAQRIGYVVSGLSYGALFLVTMNFLTGHGGGNSQGSGAQTWSAALLQQPFGPWLVGLIGLIGMAGGAGQIWQGVTTKFKDDWHLADMNADEQKAVIWAGRIGMAARGVVFIILGFFVLEAALQADPKQAQGLDGALQALAHQPFGPWLLGLVALGLVAFGLYSMLAGRWIRVTH